MLPLNFDSETVASNGSQNTVQFLQQLSETPSPRSKVTYHQSVCADSRTVHKLADNADDTRKQPLPYKSAWERKELTKIELSHDRMENTGLIRFTENKTRREETAAPLHMNTAVQCQEDQITPSLLTHHGV